MSSINYNYYRKIAEASLTTREILDTRMAFYSGDEKTVKKYLVQQPLENSNDFLYIRRPFFSPYSNPIKQIVNNLIYTLVKEEPKRDGLKGYIDNHIYKLNDNLPSVTVKEFMFEFYVYFLVMGRSHILNLEVQTEEGTMMEFYNIDTRTYKKDKDDGSISFEWYNRPAKITQQGELFHLLLGNPNNDDYIERVTKYNPLHTMVMNIDRNDLPESYISNCIWLAVGIYNLESINFFKYYKDAFNPMVISADDKTLDYYERYYQQHDKDGNPIIEIPFEPIMFKSPEGTGLEVLNIGTEYIDSLQSFIKDKKEEMKQIVNQRIVNHYNESGLSKQIDLDQSNIPLYFLSQMFERFEQDMYTKIYEKTIEIIYNQDFTSYDDEENRNTLLEIYDKTPNRKVADWIEMKVILDIGEKYYEDKKEIEDLYKEEEVKEEPPPPQGQQPES